MKSFKRIQELICESTDIIIPRGAISIPRNEMPQVEHDKYPEFFKFLNQHGISVTCKKLECQNIRIAQKEISKEKVLKFIKKLPNPVLQKWPIISADFYVVDGNHTVLSLMNRDLQIPQLDNLWRGNFNCYQIGLDLRELLELLKSFDKIIYKTVNEEKKPIFWDSFNAPFPILKGILNSS